jgi:hypothetical protein
MWRVEKWRKIPKACKTKGKLQDTEDDADMSQKSVRHKEL